MRGQAGDGKGPAGGGDAAAGAQERGEARRIDSRAGGDVDARGTGAGTFFRPALGDG